MLPKLSDIAQIVERTGYRVEFFINNKSFVTYVDDNNTTTFDGIKYQLYEGGKF